MWVGGGSLVRKLEKYAIHLPHGMLADGGGLVRKLSNHVIHSPHGMLVGGRQTR